MRGEGVELVAPELARPDAARLRAALRFAGLVAVAGRGARAAAVRSRPEAIAADFEALLRRGAVELLEDLFLAHLDAPAGLAPWTLDLTGPERPRPAAAGWRVVHRLAERGLGLCLPSPPDPGEGADEVARRLLAAAVGIGAPAFGEAEARLWRAHLVLSEDGPSAGEAAYRRVLEVADAPLAVRTAAVGAVGGALLARGAAALARDWFEGWLDLAAAVPALARVGAWAAAAAGDPGLAGELAAARGTDERWGFGSLPPVVRALGERRGELRPLLASGPWGVERASAPRAARAARAKDRTWVPRDRRSIGAAVLAVTWWDGVATPGPLDVARGLAEAAPAWHAGRRDAARTAGEPEHELLASDAPWLGAPGDGDRAARLSRGCLAPGCRVLALWPLRAPAREGAPGVLVGWVRLEFEHHLVPEAARLDALARSIVEGRVRRQAALALRGSTAAEEAARRPAVAAVPVEPAALRAALSGLLDGLGLERRRWYWVEPTADGPEVVLDGGGGLADWRASGGEGGLLARADGLGRCVRGEGPAARLFLHAGAAVGLAVPLAARGDRGPRVGWLALESTRAGDLGRSLRARLTERAPAAGVDLTLAHFEAWHAARLGRPAPFAVGSPSDEDYLASTLGVGQGVARRAGSLRLPPPDARGWLTAEWGAVVVLAGPAQSGRRGVAALVHWLDALAAGVPDPRPVEVGGSAAGERRTIDCGADLERARAWLRSGEPGARERTVLLLEPTPGSREAPGPGEVARLERALDLPAGGVVPVAPLHRRRNEVPALFARRLAGAARAQRCLVPEVEPAALALLWRQPWDGGLREVELVAERALAFVRGGSLTLGGLERALVACGGSPLRRLPSKRPDALDLAAALLASRKQNGSLHKGRAARLLGWDVDTLAARLREVRSRGPVAPRGGPT